MKKALGVLLLCCLLFSQAHALTLPPDAKIYTNPNYPMMVNTLTPLPDGAFVLAGCIRHPGEYRDMPENISYEDKEEEILIDAAAVCLNPDGTKRWSLRLADPQAENWFACQGQMPDGRLLLTFRTADSNSFGSQHFIVGLDGIVEEMLPVRKLAEIVPPRSIQLMPSGYFCDGSLPVDDVFGEDYPRTIVMLDFDFNEMWRMDHQWAYYNGIERPDGYFYLGGTIGSEGAWYGYDDLALSVCKIDRNGDKVWEFTEAPLPCFSFAWPLLFPPDGGVAFVGNYTPERTPQSVNPNEPQPQTLTKLDENGNHLWSRAYDGLWFGNAAVLGDGYVLCGQISTDAMDHDYILLHVDANGEVLGTLPIAGDDTLVPGAPSFITDEEGNVYVYASLAEPDDRINRRSGEVKSFFYAKIDENSFQ